MKKQIIATLFLFSLAAQATSMQPGQWKSTTSFKLNGIQLPKSESQGCVSPDQASDLQSTLTKGLQKDGCELKKWNLKGTQLKAELFCKNKDVEAEGNISGTVTQKSYNLEGEAKGTYKNAIPSVATIKLTGNWVSKTCKN